MVKRSAWNQTQRNLYFMQRTMGDLTAAKNGRLVKRLVRRKATRSVWGPFLRAILR